MEHIKSTAVGLLVLGAGGALVWVFSVIPYMITLSLIMGAAILVVAWAIGYLLRNVPR